MFGSIAPPMLDGACFFQHYGNPVLDEVARRLHEAARLAYIPNGFFEDEKAMLTNATANLAAARFRLIDDRPRPARAEPALIVANGPSLDASLEEIRRLGDCALVISCGTALRVLLRHGIVPDFHCETENIAVVPDLLRETGSEFGLGDIMLVASATVDPRVPPLFGESCLYFREASLSTGLLAGPDQELSFTAPTVANVAVRVAFALGFRTLYLFGVDCGSRFQRDLRRASADSTGWQCLCQSQIDAQPRWPNCRSSPPRQPVPSNPANKASPSRSPTTHPCVRRLANSQPLVNPQNSVDST